MAELRPNKPAQDAPAPPPAPRVFVTPDEPEELEGTQSGQGVQAEADKCAQAAATNTETSAQQPGKRRRRVSVSTVIGIVAIIAVVAGAYFGWQAFNSANEKPTDTRLADTKTTSGASSSGSDSSESSEEVSAAKQAVQAQLTALANDEDGAFRAVVDKFVEAYDGGVTQGAYSMSDLGITGEDLAPLLRSEFACEITKVDVYNGTAWVTISVTSKNVSDAAGTFTNSVVGLVSGYNDEESYKAALKDAFTSAIEKQKPRTVTVLLTVPSSNDTWELDDSNVESLLGSAWYS